MLEFSSEPKTLDFKIDGEVYGIPLTLPIEQAMEYAKLAKSGEQDTASAMAWFVQLVHDATGGKADSFGDIEITALLRAWTEEREKEGEVGAGES